MNIPIHQLDEEVPAKILERGLDYYLRDLVGDLEETSSGAFSAVVYGSNEYAVKITIMEEVLIEAQCDCPYDLHPLCKHIVAVMQIYVNGPIPKKKPKKSTRKKRMTKQEKINKLLDKLSDEEVKGYLGSLLDGDKEIRNDFLINFSHLLEEKLSYSFYDKQIKESLRSIKGRQGFIAWNETRKLWPALRSLYLQSDAAVQGSNYQKASYITTALLKNLVKALDYSDDSSGDLGDLIDRACYVMRLLVVVELPADTHDYLWAFCIKEFKANTFKGWDWHLMMMELAASLSRNKKEADEVVKLLSIKSLSEYSNEKAQHLKLQLLSQYMDAADIAQMQHEQRANPSIRTDLIKNHIAAKNYKEAIIYAQEGQTYDKEKKPGLVRDWIEWELKIAQLQKNKKEILRLARIQYLDNWRPAQDYLALIKALVPKSKWPKYREQLIVDIIKRKGQYSNQLLEQFYINENLLGRLLKYLQDGGGSLYLNKYEPHLGKKYPKELSDLYEQHIFKLLSPKGMQIKRKTYQAAAGYIRRIRKLTTEKRAASIAEELRKKYPRRSALLDELSGF